MDPLIIDIILAILSILLIWSGYKHGFIQAFGSLLGLVVSIALGIWGVTWLEDLTGFELTSNPVVFVGTFLILTLIVSQIIRLIVSALDLVRRLVSIIPFVGLLNSLLGLVLGVFQAGLLIAAVTYVTVTYLPSGVLYNALVASEIISTTIDLGQQFGLL